MNWREWKKAIPERDNSDFLDEFLDTSLTCAHSIHHLAILLDFYFLLSVFGLVHFFFNFFFHNLSGVDEIWALLAYFAVTSNCFV